MSITTFNLDTTELFAVLPEASMRASWIGNPDQIDRWETLNGDERDIKEIVTNPVLLAGTAFWVENALHALVLRNAARQEERLAEVMWDLGMERFMVLVAP